MVKNYLLRRCYNALSTLQLQSRLPGASQHHSCFAPHSRATEFCHSRLQTRTAGVSHQIDPPSRSAHNVETLCFFRQYGSFCCRSRVLVSAVAGLAVDKKSAHECSESSTSRENCKNLRRSEKPRMFSPVNSRIPNCYSSLLLPHTNCFCLLCC